MTPVLGTGLRINGKSSQDCVWLQVLVYTASATRCNLVQRWSCQTIDCSRQLRHSDRLHSELRDDETDERECQHHQRQRQFLDDQPSTTHLARRLQRGHTSRCIHTVVQLLDTGQNDYYIIQ